MKTTNDATYRKHNDHSLNSSTYHKKDAVSDSRRAILKREAEEEIAFWEAEELMKEEIAVRENNPET